MRESSRGSIDRAVISRNSACRAAKQATV